jgi:osmotically-inducible protein OsmY
MDDGIRIATHRTISANLASTVMPCKPSPRCTIVVASGKVTLEGVVATEGDKNQAGIYTNTVSGVFSVTNNLRVEGDRK